ncbi:MAG: adenylyltransferase/cytidyltransferase family protein [Victivallaceae bacterium]|nr:adenylyltransferase/cytidyltransferase family protein [Victivallaceae bacterium]
MELSKDPACGIMTLDAAAVWRKNLRRSGRKLVITNGCFDIMHRGHAEYLLASRNVGDALLVLVNSDAAVRALKGESRPIIDEYSRAYMLTSLAAVDAVVIFDSPRCDRELAALAPDFYVKGGDYTLDKLDPGERAALQGAGTQIVFKPFIPGFSTTTIIERIRKSS